MPPKPKKIKSRRDREKYPALVKNKMPRVRQEQLDLDYIDQLSDSEKEWLNKFMDEYLNASFKHDDTDIQSYEKYGKDSNDRNNSRNRCAYGILKNTTSRLLVQYHTIGTEIENQLSQDINPMNLENAYVDYIEFKQLEEFLQEYDAAMAVFREPE